MGVRFDRARHGLVLSRATVAWLLSAATHAETWGEVKGDPPVSIQLDTDSVRSDGSGGYLATWRSKIGTLDSFEEVDGILLDWLAPPAGVEPTTYRLGGGRSIH